MGGGGGGDGDGGVCGCCCEYRDESARRFRGTGIGEGGFKLVPPELRRMGENESLPIITAALRHTNKMINVQAILASPTVFATNSRRSAKNPSGA